MLNCRGMILRSNGASWLDLFSKPTLTKGDVERQLNGGISGFKIMMFKGDRESFKTLKSPGLSANLFGKEGLD